MSEMKTILVLNAIINKENMAELPTYLGGVMPIFAKHGGKLIGKYKTVQQLAGEESPEIIAIHEFPNAEVINNMINGNDFEAFADLRAKVFTKLNMVICNEM
jgi:uncharacterized protein (DUF1330 family)